MNEYLALKHMESIPPNEIDKPDVYYIPHHAVFNRNKIRVVFNASMPSQNCLSLNSVLSSGRKLQQDIVLVLNRCRCYKVVFVCDIVKIFRQILVDARGRDWLRILSDFGKGLQQFRLCTVTYGTACAPYQALRILWEILKRICPNSANMLLLFLRLSYIDDFFGGADTWEQALEIHYELIETLKAAKMELGKLSVNRKELLSGITNIDQND